MLRESFFSGRGDQSQAAAWRGKVGVVKRFDDDMAINSLLTLK